MAGVLMQPYEHWKKKKTLEQSKHRLQFDLKTEFSPSCTFSARFLPL